MQICSNCGSPVEGNFCLKCGQAVTHLSEPAQSPPPPQDESSSQLVQVQPLHQAQAYPPQAPPEQTTDPDILLPQKMESSHFAFLIIAFLVGAFLAPVLAMPFQFLVSSGDMPIETDLIVSAGIVAPITEELFKFLPVLLISLYFSRFIRSRKEGALVGAVTGLGFALMEDLIYFLNFQSIAYLYQGHIANAAFGRLISLPFTHVIFSAWWGIAIYIIIANRRNPQNVQSVQGTPAFMSVIIAIGIHMAWNMLLVMFSLFTTITNATLLTIIAILVIGIPSIVLLRYVLGGSFGISKRVIITLRVLGIVGQPETPEYYGSPQQPPTLYPAYKPPQPSYQQPVASSIPPPQQQQFLCPRCGTQLVWSVQYERMWCGYCRSFI